ncbi:helix-turn-helix domain-containing protein [Streptomyces sp. SID4951]|nr:helix-turn-helix domain-containing protein [Streptomyces sp. SID4951]
MGRPENPIDPQDGPVQRFAYELRKLRDEAGAPAYRAMARRAGYSAATLSQAAAGERLPTLPVLLAYVRACGGDEEEWRRRWTEADEAVSQQPRSPEDDTDPPYRGLVRFEPGDAELFFGRDELTAQLAGTARRHRVTALVGASGSGSPHCCAPGSSPACATQTVPPTRRRPLCASSPPAHTPWRIPNVWSRPPGPGKPGCWWISSKSCSPSAAMMRNAGSSWSDCWPRATRAADCAWSLPYGPTSSATVPPTGT